MQDSPGSALYRLKPSPRKNLGQNRGRPVSNRESETTPRLKRYLLARLHLALPRELKRAACTELQPNSIPTETSVTI